jgi:hypothetical protein
MFLVKKEIQMGSPSWTSPDGKAIIYQSHCEENKRIIISLSTWIETGFLSGGGGIFTCSNYRLDTVKVNWTSDTSALIEYPKTATVIKKELQAYFAGRTIHLTYKPVTY